MNIIEDTKSKLKEIEFKLKILECKLMLLRLPHKQFAGVISLLKQHIENYENESKTSSNPIGYYPYPYGGPRAGEPDNHIIDQLAYKGVEDKPCGTNSCVVHQERAIGSILMGEHSKQEIQQQVYNQMKYYQEKGLFKIFENSKVNEK